MNIANLKLSQLSIAILMTLSLSACNIESTQRIKDAQASADASELLEHLAEDEETLLNYLISELEKNKAKQQKAIKSILTEHGRALNLELQASPGSSITISANDLLYANNLMLSDSNQALSVIADVRGARLIGYGSNVIKAVNSNQNLAHKPILKRSINWLITGNANNTPKNLTVASVGYNHNALKTYFINTYHMNARVVECNLFDNNQSCWKNADLLVIGHDHTPNSRELSNLKTTFGKYQDRKKPIFYLAKNWSSANDGRTQFLVQYGINPDGYPGNYFKNPAELKSSNTRSVDDIIAQNDSLSATIDALKALRDNKTPTQADAEKMIKGVQLFAQAMNQKNSQGQSIFDNRKTELLQAMVLLADIWRDGVRYDGFSKQQNPLRYLKTSIADSWLDFKRVHTIAPKNGAGDYMPVSAYDMPVSNQWETITLTLPQKSGYTAIGRASIPAKGLQVQVVDNKGKARLAVQTGYMRTTKDRNKPDIYNRPAKATSPSILLNNNKPTNFVSPYGGALFLKYDNAKAGDTITLKVKGGAKYAHFDFVKGMNQSEINEAMTALRSGKFGWNTMKFTGGEIQQTMKYAQKSIGNQAPEEYISRVKTVIFDSNHIANGYNNIPLDAMTQQQCSILNWDCTGKIHNAPSVQHFVGWLAACGYMCSGQPVDAFAGVDTSWGWVHELGHNTVQPVLSMTFKSTKDGKTIGCANECNNNILAGLSFLRKYEIYGEDDKDHNFGHYLLYQQLEESRATGKTGEALRADTEARIWSGNGLVNNDGKRAVHMQLAFLYSKLNRKQAQPDAQAVLEFFRLLNIGNRLADKINWKHVNQADKAKLGLSAYSKKSYSNPELTFMLSSKIIGYDLTDVFAFYGLPLSNTAKQSVARLNLPKAPLSFYAQAEGEANLLANGQWIENVSLQGELPEYPF